MGSWAMVADRRRAHEFAQTAVNVTWRASVSIVGFETLWRPHCSVLLTAWKTCSQKIYESLNPEVQDEGVEVGREAES